MTVSARKWLTALALALLVVGCSTTVTGTAVKVPSSSGGDGVDVALLDSGNYPTSPQPALGVAGSPSEGATVEAHRMAANVVGPWEADTSLTEYEESNTGAVKDSDRLNYWLGKPVGDGVVGHHFVAGFSSSRHNATGRYKELMNIVLRFASPQDAAAAAQDMAARSASSSIANDVHHPQPFPLPRYPASAAITYQWGPVPSRGDVPTAVMAFTAHGPYVLAQNASADTVANAAQFVVTALDLQEPLIDKFTPTPVDQLAQLPIDPSGLLARTLPPSTGSETVNDGDYDAHGALHVEPGDPVHLQALFTSAGIQQAAETAEARVYQAPDPAGANRIVADYAVSQDPAAPGVSGMPKAKCFTEKLGSWCVGAADRYAFFAQSAQLPDLHQRMAAQYRLLTGK